MKSAVVYLYVLNMVISLAIAIFANNLHKASHPSRENVLISTWK